MPTYVYLCPICGQFEAQQSIRDEAFKECGLCKSPVQRVPQLTPAHLTGRGFYATDTPTAKRPI